MDNSYYRRLPGLPSSRRRAAWWSLAILFRQRGHVALCPAASHVSPDGACHESLGFVRQAIPVCPHEVEGRGLRPIRELPSNAGAFYCA